MFKKKLWLIFFILILSKISKAQTLRPSNKESVLFQKALLYVETGKERLKQKDSISAFKKIQLSESYLPKLSKKEALDLKVKITGFYILWLNIKNPVSRGDQDEGSIKIHTLAYGLANKTISEIGESQFFSNSANLALISKNKSFYLFAKTSFAENLFTTDKPASALPILDTLSNEPSLTTFEKMHILSLLVINSIKLNKFKNLRRYFNDLQTLNKKAHSKVDQLEFLLAGAWYFDHLNNYANAANNFKKFLLVYGKDGLYNEQTTESLIRLGSICSKQNRKDSADYYLRRAKRMLAAKDVTAEAKVMYSIAYTNYLHQASNVSKSVIYNEADTSVRSKIENSTRQLELKYKLELKKQQLTAYEQSRRMEQLNYTSNLQRAWIFIILLVMILLVGVFIAVIFYQRRRQAMALKQTEIDTLKQIHRNEIITVLANSQRVERKIIAEILHDEVGSLLTLARLNLSGLDDKNKQNISVKKINTVNEILSYVADSIRQMSHRLMPATMVKLGFKKAIFQIVEDINEASQINVETLIIGFDDPCKFTEAFQTDFYHIIQELFQNMIKHSAATEASLQLFEHKSSINLIMEDNGRGFGEINNIENGKGLFLMKSRVELYGGSINIEGNSGAGTIIIIDIPNQNIVNSGFKNEPEYSETLPG